MHQLDRDAPIELRIERRIHRPHAPFADPRLDAIPPDRLRILGRPQRDHVIEVRAREICEQAAADRALIYVCIDRITPARVEAPREVVNNAIRRGA